MSDKPDNDPGPEVRKRIVDDIMKKVEAKEPRPDSETAELDELLKVKTKARAAVVSRMHQVVEAAKMLPVTDPNYLHCDRGRAVLFMQFQRAYLEELRDLNREEAIFMLSLAWAEFTLNEFV